MPPPASVPAKTGTPASKAARTTAPDCAYSRRIVLAYAGNFDSPAAANSGKFVDVDQRRDDGGAPGRHARR